MRKNFLLVFLLALLPWVGWAQDGVGFKVGNQGDIIPDKGSTPFAEGISLYSYLGDENVLCNWYYSEDGANYNPVQWMADYNNYCPVQKKGYYMACVFDEDVEEETGEFGVIQVGVDPLTPVASDTWKEVQVKGVSGVSMPYGGEIEMTEDNAINVISLVGLELNTEEDALKKLIIAKLKINNAEQLKTLNVGTYPYSLGLKYSSQNEVLDAIEAGEESENYGTYNTVELDGVTYKISPIDDAQVNIVKGQNELTTIDDELALQPLTLSFNGELQNLVGVEPEDAKPATLGGVEYFMLTEAEYAALVAATENPAPEDPADYTIPENAKWSEVNVIPQAIPVGSYYIWARAAETANYTGSEPAYVGEAVITAVKPIFAGTINIKDSYYFCNLHREPGNFKHLVSSAKEDFSPVTGTFTVKLNADATAETVKADEVTYWLQTGIKNGDEISWGPTIQITDADAWNNFRFTYENNYVYRVIAQFVGNDHFVPVNYDESEVFQKFDVLQPTLTIQTTPNPATIGYGTDPVFGYSLKWEGWTDPEFEDPEDVTYSWYADEACQNPIFSIGNMPTGTYWVKVDNNFNVRSCFDVDIKPAQVIITSGEILAKIEDQELVYGETLPLQLTYDSGAFVEGSQEAENFENVIWNEGFIAKNTETEEEIELYGWTTGYGFNQTLHTTLLPVGTWEVRLAPQQYNDLLIVGKGTWTVTPKDIKNEDFNNPRVAGLGGTWDLSMTYTSEQLVPGEEELEGKFVYQTNQFRPYQLETLVYGKDFEVINPGENINAGEGAGTFTVKGIGNYTGEVELAFDIEKALLFVKPIAATWQIDTPEPNETYAIDWDDVKTQLKQFKNDRNGKLDLTTANGFKDLAVKRVERATAGYYEYGVEAYLPEDAAPADNYEFVFGQAPLTIEKGLIQLKLAAQKATYNGTTKPVYNLGAFELAGPENLNPILVEDDNWQMLLKFDDEKSDQIKITDNLEPDENGRYNAGTYKITYEFPEGTVYSTNYEIEIVEPTEAELVVEPMEITVAARNFRTIFHTFLDEDNKIDQAKIDAYIASITTKTVGEGDDAVTEVNDAAVTVDPGLGTGDVVKDVVAEIQVEGIVAGDEGNAIKVIPAENPNYIITTEDGKLTVLARRGITLYSEDDVKELNDDDEWVVTEAGDMTTLNAYNNQPVQWVNVYIKQPSIEKNGEEKAITWNADQWYSLVFPFDVTVREISNAFGYAIVNIADPENTTENNVMFKLQKITDVIPANTPFTVKTDTDIDTYGEEGEGYLMRFNGTRYIQLPENGYPSVLIEDPASLGYTFDGTYETMTIDKSKSYLRFLYNDGWKYVGSSSATVFTLKPYTGYVNLGEGNGARNVTFTFEEADGTTTSINAMDFINGKANDAEGIYNLNGMKLKNAPARKGVYIQNGQKVVVK